MPLTGFEGPVSLTLPPCVFGVVAILTKLAAEAEVVLLGVGVEIVPVRPDHAMNLLFGRAGGVSVPRTDDPARLSPPCGRIDQRNLVFVVGSFGHRKKEGWGDARGRALLPLPL